MKLSSHFFNPSFFTKASLYLGLIFINSKLNAENNSGHNPQKASSPYTSEANQTSLHQSHPLQNEALKKLLALSICSSPEKTLSVEDVNSKIKASLKSNAGKFFESHHIDITTPNKEKPLAILELKENLKNEKLAHYFSKVFSKLYETEVANYYFNKNIGRSQKISPEDLFDKIHQEYPEISKALQEAAQDMLKKANTVPACKEPPKTLEGKTKEIENKLEDARKELRNTPVSESTGISQKIDLSLQELQSLKKIKESSQKLFDQINKETPISTELLKETQLAKKDMTFENIADLKIKHQDLSQKEEAFKKSEKNYNLANLKYKDAVKKASGVNIEQTEVHKNLNEARKLFEDSKKELEVAQKAEKNLNEIEKYAYLLASIDSDFKSITEDPGSKSGQENLKYLKDKAGVLFQDGKLKMGNPEEIRDVKKALLKKYTEKGLIQRCFEGVCKFFSGEATFGREP